MPRSQLEKLWIAGAGLLGLILVLIGYFFFIGPQRSQTSNVDSEVSTARSSNASLQDRIAHLETQNRDLKSFETVLAHSRLALPATSGIPDFLRTLQSIGNATGSDVSSLTVGTPVGISLNAIATSNATVPSSTTSSSSSNPNAAATAAPGGAAAGPAATANTPAGAVYALPISAQITGSTKALEAFLTQLQQIQPRAVLINQITETVATATGPGSATGVTAGTTTMQLNMQAFVAPTDKAEAASLSQAAGK